MATTHNGDIGDGSSGHSHLAGAATADADSVREQAERILADPLFGNSKRYSHLLKYIVDRTLEGNHEDLKERTIGVEVFGRAPDYDTALDPTVRVVATEVRKRLALYYSKRNRDQELRIDIPVRSYLAKFAVPKQNYVPAEPQPAPAPVLVLAEPPRKHRFRYFGAPAAVIVLAIAAWILYRFLAPIPVIDKFWAPALHSTSSDVLICISTSPSLTPGPSLEPLPSSASIPGMPLYEFNAQRVNVSMTDVYAANALATFLKQKGKNSFEQPTKTTSLENLRLRPAVFLGSYSNDWTLRLGAGLHFRFNRESDVGPRWIEDQTHPENRNWSVNMSTPYDQVKDDYALVTRVLDPTTGQWWIGIGGLTGLGTLAANRMLMDPSAMAHLGTHLPTNWERKNLQVVLDIKMVQGSPGTFQVVATYSW